MRWAIAFILLLTLISVRVHALAITEVMPDCGNLTANCEFVEIYSASDVDLRGYVLDTQGQSLKFNTSFSGYLVITKNKNAFIKRFGSGPTEGYVIEWKAMGLANGGDVVTLIYENKSVGSFEYENGAVTSKMNVRKDLEINLWHPNLKSNLNQWTHIRQVFKDGKIFYYTDDKLVYTKRSN